MKRKIGFKCVCSHPEEIHNFDPDSLFFGCMEKFFSATQNPDGSISEPEQHLCRCDEFRPDNLRYLEERSER